MGDVGRPRLYADEEVFADAVDAYFASLEDSGKKPTLAGLCYHMGFSDKESFGHYETYGDGFSRTIKRTRMRIEDDRWQALIDKGTFTPGIIFDLKNNHGWRDKTEQEVSGSEDAPLRIELVAPDYILDHDDSED